MKQRVFIIAVCCFLTLGVGAAAWDVFASQTKTFTFLRQGVPPGGTVGEPYAGFSFCNPRPATGQFCGKVLQKNAVAINPNGGTPNYTFSTGVGLPFGLKLNLNGVLSGTPTKAGSYDFKVCAKDRVGHSKCNSYHIDIQEKAKKITYPSSALDVRANTINYLLNSGILESVTEKQFLASFGRIVRDYSISGVSLENKPRQAANQTHFCFDTKDCGGACGLCFGPQWSFRNQWGCEIRITMNGTSYYEQKNQTTYSLGVVSDPCNEAGSNADLFAKATKTEPTPDGGLVATMELEYLTFDENSQAVLKKMPEFKITIGGARSISVKDAQALIMEGKAENITY
jgi:hypothetical protein